MSGCSIPELLLNPEDLLSLAELIRHGVHLLSHAGPDPASRRGRVSGIPLSPLFPAWLYVTGFTVIV
jgi:hypothetical protein